MNLQSATLVTVGYNYIGASADINVWKPYVQRPDEYTTAQIWLQAGPGNNFESVEAGWVVITPNSISIFLFHFHV